VSAFFCRYNPPCQHYYLLSSLSQTKSQKVKEKDNWIKKDLISLIYDDFLDLSAHTCVVSCPLNISKYTTFKPIARLVIPYIILATYLTLKIFLTLYCLISNICQKIFVHTAIFFLRAFLLFFVNCQRTILSEGKISFFKNKQKL